MASSASTWKIDEFKNLGILYKDTPDTLEYFSGIINRKIGDRKMNEMLSSLTTYFVEYTEQNWSFSVDLNVDDDLEEITGITSTISALEFLDENIVRMKAKFDDDIRSYLPSDTKAKERALEVFSSLFHRWRTNLKEFMSCFHMILCRWRIRREELFTHMFTAFSRIAFLIPESGHLYNRSTMIDNESVNGMPDLRFETHPKSRTSSPKLVVVTEVKQYDAFRGKWTRINFTCGNNISSSVLAQHGIELLLEMNNSLFIPRVFGFLCIGTKARVHK